MTKHDGQIGGRSSDVTTLLSAGGGGGGEEGGGEKSPPISYSSARRRIRTLVPISFSLLRLMYYRTGAIVVAIVIISRLPAFPTDIGRTQPETFGHIETTIVLIPRSFHILFLWRWQYILSIMNCNVFFLNINGGWFVRIRCNSKNL